MLKISTIPEALATLDKLTGRTWTDSELFDIATDLGIEMHSAAPITALVIVEELVKGKGFVAKDEGMVIREGGLAELLPWQVAQLWVNGETLTNRAYSKNDREEEGERIVFTEQVRVTREQVRLRSDTLQYIYNIWQNAQAGRWIKDDTAPKGMRHQNGPEWMFPEDPNATAIPIHHDWIEKVQAIAQEIGLERYSKGTREITSRNVSDAAAERLSKDITTHGNRGPRSSNNVRTVGLRGWKFNPPKDEKLVD